MRTLAREVFDVQGAGDTSIAALALALRAGATLLEAAVIANAAAGVVVGKVGTATASVDEVRELLPSTLGAARECRVIRSMTGFGRAGFGVQDARFDVEVRSVNHRFLDARDPAAEAARGARVRRARRDPAPLRARQGGSHRRVAGRRGQGDRSSRSTSPRPRQYLRAAAALREAEGVGGELSVASVLSLPGVARFIEPELPAAELREGLFASVEAALEALDGMRAAEGAALERDLLARLERVVQLDRVPRAAFGAGAGGGARAAAQARPAARAGDRPDRRRPACTRRS